MRNMSNNNSNAYRRSHGFTLLEVMFAIMIMGIGLIAIASLFPVAGNMQRSAYEDAMGMQVSTSVEVMLRSRPIPLDLNGTTWTADGKVHKISDTDLITVWPLKDRSFPQTESDVDKRTYYWRPFYRYNNNLGPSGQASSWELYVLISKRPEGATAPDESAYVAGHGSVAAGVPAFKLGEIVIHKDNGLIGTVTKVAKRDNNDNVVLDFDVNGQDATEGNYWHVIQNGHATTLEVLKVSTGGVK